MKKFKRMTGDICKTACEVRDICCNPDKYPNLSEEDREEIELCQASDYDCFVKIVDYEENS